jgi:hypothetical protein
MIVIALPTQASVNLFGRYDKRNLYKLLSFLLLSKMITLISLTTQTVS